MGRSRQCQILDKPGARNRRSTSIRALRVLRDVGELIGFLISNTDELNLVRASARECYGACIRWDAFRRIGHVGDVARYAIIR